MDTIFILFLLLIGLQRISELFYAKRNERILKEKGAAEYDAGGYKVIVIMHVMFFVSLVSERLFLETAYNFLSPYLFVVFVLAQFLRYWAISSLGQYWNTKLLVLHGCEPVARGPYKYLRHPNYVAVVTELAVIPLIFSCYITAVVFSIINLGVLRRRIEIEEKALGLDK